MWPVFGTTLTFLQFPPPPTSTCWCLIEAVPSSWLTLDSRGKQVIHQQARYYIGMSLARQPSIKSLPHPFGCATFVAFPVFWQPSECCRLTLLWRRAWEALWKCFATSLKNSTGSWSLGKGTFCRGESAAGRTKDTAANTWGPWHFCMSMQLGF